MKFRVPVITVALLMFLATAFGQTSQFSPSALNAGTLTLSGMVTTADGRPVRDARIEIHNALNGSEVASGYTLPGGSFTFNNVPSGHYEIRAISGLQEARERVELDHANQTVTVRIAEVGSQTSATATVSVVEMQVPSKAKKEFEKAQEAFAKHKTDEAREHCNKALAVAPTYSRALSMSALLDLSDNKLEEAAKQAEQSIKSDYGYAMGYVVLGAIYNSMQRYDDAVRTLDRGIPMAPTAWQAHFEMAKALLGKGDYQRSLTSIDRAIEVAPPEYGPVHLVRAHVLLALKAYQQAMVELEKYIGDDPNSSDSAQARKTLDQVKAYVSTSKK